MDSANVVGFVSPVSNQLLPPKRFAFAAGVTPAPSVKFALDTFGSLAVLGSVVSVPVLPKVFQLSITAVGASVSPAGPLIVRGAGAVCGVVLLAKILVKLAERLTNCCQRDVLADEDAIAA